MCNVDHSASDHYLLQGLLKYDPSDRLTAGQPVRPLDILSSVGTAWINFDTVAIILTLR